MLRARLCIVGWIALGLPTPVPADVASSAVAAEGEIHGRPGSARDGAGCHGAQPTGSRRVSPEVTERYLVAAVAHSVGAGDSRWRSDLAAVNRGDHDAEMTLTFPAPTGPEERTARLAASATREWRDVLVSLFGYPDEASVAGALHVVSTAPLAISSRTYNQSATGTYGQFLPALRAGDALGPGAAALLPQLRNTDEFYTNVGILNLGDGAATATVTLHAGDGATVGTAFDVSAPAGSWKQANDVFRSSGAGGHEVAYATVELSSGAAAWAYASVVDRSTRDPTTIPMTLGAPATAGLKTRAERPSWTDGTVRGSALREPEDPTAVAPAAAAHPTVVRPALEARIAAAGDAPIHRFGSVDPTPRGGRRRPPSMPSKLTELERPVLDLSRAYGTHPERRAVDAAAAGRPRIALDDGHDVPPRVVNADAEIVAPHGNTLGDPVAATGRRSRRRRCARHRHRPSRR